jgi:type IV pilus assembly protein PilW
MTTAAEKGFSLIELTIAMGISTFVLAAIYVNHRYQTQSYVAQEHVSDMQQNLRAAMYVLSRDLRMAGYDPLVRDDKSNDGFDNDCDGLVDEAGELVGILEAKADYVKFNMNLYDGVDNDSDGDKDEPDEAGLLDLQHPFADLEPCGPNEVVAYALFTTGQGVRCLGRQTAGGTLQAVAENIDALDFVYLDEDGDVLDDGNGNATDDRDKIRSVQITMVARSRKEEGKIFEKSEFRNLQEKTVFQAPGDHFRRLSQKMEIRCRNLGIAQKFAEMQN